MPGLQKGIPESGRPALPCGADGVSGVRAGVVGGRTPLPRRRGRGGGRGKGFGLPGERFPLPGPPPRGEGARLHRRRAAPPASRPDPRHQGPGRLPPGLRRPRYRRRSDPARAQEPGGEALRRHGGQPGFHFRLGGNQPRRGGTAAIPRAAHRPAAQEAGGRRGLPRHRAGTRLAGRHAALHAPALADLPRGCGSARRHGMDGPTPGADAGDDQRQPGRRAPGDPQRRGGGAPGRHCRWGAHARPGHRGAV